MNLTLTRVVFEFCYQPRIWIKSNRFNFNKSCIWIEIFGEVKKGDWNLTLTRVVFEYTNVVILNFRLNRFNFNKSCIWIDLIYYTKTYTC